MSSRNCRTFKIRAPISSHYENPSRVKAMSSSKICRMLKIRTSIFASYKSAARTKTMSSKLFCRMLRNRRSLRSFAASTSLPDDIIAMILSRLPIKPLLKFRCVSKSWCSLVSSNHFVRSHLEISKKNPDFNTSIIIIDSVVESLSVSTLKHFPLHSLPTKPCPHPSDFDHSFTLVDQTFPSLLVVGSCNGLYCAIVLGEGGRGGKEFLLWNPTTRKSTIISPKMDMCNMSYSHAHGFGYDESNDDYKVFVCMVNRVLRETVVHIYSFKTNSCTKIYHHPFKNIFINQLGKFTNGKLYWILSHDENATESNFGIDIISFDMVSETFGVVEQPPVFLDQRFYPTLGVLDGFLCVVSSNCRSRKDIWVLKESWNKLISFPFKPPVWDSGLMPVPLCITPEGKFMYVSGKVFYIVDPKNNFYPRMINHCVIFVPIVCGQSLVSPFFCDGDENQRQWRERPIVDEDGESRGTLGMAWKHILGEENQKQWYQSGTCPVASRISFQQQPELTKRQRRPPTWMKDYVN